MTPLDYVTVPAAVFHLADVNLRQKILLGLAVSFNQHGLKMCNDALAEILDVCPSYVTKLLADLEVKNYVRIDNAQSRHRRIYLAQNEKVNQLILQHKVQSKKTLLQHKVQSKKGLLCTGAPSTPAQSANRIEIIAALKTNIFRPNSEPFRLSQLLLDLILARKRDFRQPNLTVWAKHVDRIIRLNHRAPEAIEAVIRWSQNDPFWQDNILSTEKLRKQLDRLELQMAKSSKRNDNVQNREQRRYDRDFAGQTSSVGSFVEM